MGQCEGRPRSMTLRQWCCTYAACSGYGRCLALKLTLHAPAIIRCQGASTCMWLAHAGMSQVLSGPMLHAIPQPMLLRARACKPWLLQVARGREACDPGKAAGG